MTVSDLVTMMIAFVVIKLGRHRDHATRTEYLASAVILWVAIWIATAGVLDDSAFDDMVPIFSGGTFFFVVLLPAALFRGPRQ